MIYYLTVEADLDNIKTKHEHLKKTQKNTSVEISNWRKRNFFFLPQTYTSIWSLLQDNYTFAQPGIQKKVKMLEELVSRIDGKS